MDNLQDQQGDMAWYRSLYAISLTSKILNFKAHSIVIDICTMPVWEHYAQNYIDPIRTYSQNLEDLHRTV